MESIIWVVSKDRLQMLMHQFTFITYQSVDLISETSMAMEFNEHPFWSSFNMDIGLLP